MNENYLWDKTGADAEIEDLENALQAFRYQETAAPRLPIKVVPLRRETNRRHLRLAFAVAACLTFAVIFTGVLFQILNNKTATEIHSAQINTPEVKASSNNNLTAKEQRNPVVEKIEEPKQSPKRMAIKISQTVPLVARHNKKPARAVKPKIEKAVKLTEEEKYAYNQLMLALSITSSKLKIVKDKVEGSE
jgi:hypothetical protein